MPLQGLLCTSDRDEAEDLAEHYPDRWHIEQFFKKDQDLGWKVAGTRNLYIRFGKMTLALAAQVASGSSEPNIGLELEPMWVVPALTPKEDL